VLRVSGAAGPTALPLGHNRLQRSVTPDGSVAMRLTIHLHQHSPHVPRARPEQPAVNERASSPGAMRHNRRRPASALPAANIRQWNMRHGALWSFRGYGRTMKAGRWMDELPDARAEERPQNSAELHLAPDSQ
jgi:hypothetical protein